MKKGTYGVLPKMDLATVPNLSTICLQSIATNFKENPIYDVLTPLQKDFVHERLSTSLKLHMTAHLINDGIYWKRRCEERWDLCDVSDYAHSWKRMFFERHMENIIELFIPGVTNPKTVQEMLPLCTDFVKRLNVTQLLLPVRELHKEEEDAGCTLHSFQFDEPSVDHFDFKMLLPKLTNLEELHVVYRVKQCGMNFEWQMFEMTYSDCLSLGEALKSCKSLKRLRLYDSCIDDVKCRTLVKFLLDHPSLKELDFSFNQIGYFGARALGKLLTRSKLEKLNLRYNNISDSGSRALAHALSKNPALMSLNLSLNGVRDKGGEAICKALLKNNVLRHLHLGANEVTGPTAIALSEVLACNNTLESFDLSGNMLGVDGGEALKMAMLSNTTVTRWCGSTGS